MTDNLRKSDIAHQLMRPIAKMRRIYLNILNPQVRVLTDPLKFIYLFPDKKTLYGPFKGMSYPKYESVCSMIYPKLMGSYEREIQQLFEQFSTCPYTEIIDIGCAEGYYAVGLAMRNKHAKVFAYDTDESARELCGEMAELNKVSSKIVIKSFCSASELETFPFTGRGLIICDCEGYESELFNRGSIENLKKCDLLIETHDFLKPNISKNLKKLFSPTHSITSIKSINDFKKAQTYAYPETDNLSVSDKQQIFAERRPVRMEWLFCKSKAG